MKNSPTSTVRTQSLSDNDIQEQIRTRAYELYEQGGRKDGHDLDDWLEAESEVRRKSQAAAA